MAGSWEPGAGSWQLAAAGNLLFAACRLPLAARISHLATRISWWESAISYRLPSYRLPATGYRLFGYRKSGEWASLQAPGVSTVQCSAGQGAAALASKAAAPGAGAVPLTPARPVARGLERSCLGRRSTKLEVWRQARELLRIVSTATADMRKKGDLKPQMRRAVISVASNIAEGSNVVQTCEFHRFLAMACGSAAEIGALRDHRGRHRLPR